MLPTLFAATALSLTCVTPFDLTTLSSVVGLVLLLAAAAALLPAARAALAEPARILRED